jgi:tetratricopeptide (TPR) repeat protein
MISRIKLTNLFRFLVVVAAGGLIISCGPKAQKPTSQLDTPEHHTFTGIRLLNQEKFVDAGREFELALRLEPKYSKAHAGVGLVKGYQGDFEGGFVALKQAEKYAKSDEEKVFAQVGYIRVNTLSHAGCLLVGSDCKPDDSWLENAKSAFDKAVLIDPKSSAAYYFMGEAWLSAFDLDQAGAKFSKVLALNTEYVKEADNRWKLVQKIQRAMPGTAIGKKIALVEKITRADAAALFLEELKVDVLYARRTLKTFDTAFKDPDAAKQVKPVRAPATDIATHPLKADIDEVVRIGMRGLEPYPDGTFRPDGLVDRATYAMMIEDILIKVSGDNALATKFIGTTSPFPDLRADLPYFNAVMVMTSRGLMEAKDMVSGEFAPFDAVGGADALLVIRKMREELRF